MKACSTGFAGRMKSSCTPRRYAQSSRAPGHEFGAVIDGDRAYAGGPRKHPIERRPDGLAGDRRRYLQDRTLTAPVIDRGQHPEWPPVGQRVALDATQFPS
jgi:hypothetical protein